MTRLLKSRLTLATFKTSRGWQNLALDSIAPRLTEEAQRNRRECTAVAARSDPRALYSNVPVDCQHARYAYTSQRPRTASTDDGYLHRAWADPLHVTRETRDLTRLHQSSPVTKSTSYNNTYVSSHCLNTYPFLKPVAHSSPPRTPPHALSTHAMTPHTGEEGVDLLIYLATSPSPSQASLSARFPPNTPQNFDLSDFVNITPSPAQVAWSSRTPGSTPARKRLTYDQPLPSSSPATPGQHSLRFDVSTMELGGELTM